MSVGLLTDRLVCEAMYQKYGPENRCAYCGDPADTIDHTVPVSFTAGHARTLARAPRKFVKVAACCECNGLLGNQLHATWRERKRWLWEKFCRRNARFLKQVEWDADDLAEMSAHMAKTIRGYVQRAKVIRRREAILRTGSWPDDVPQDLWPDAGQ
jgi:5-methylcytosine-specific restriction endonuclease McrA